MFFSSLFASLHYIAFAAALGGVFMRGIYFRQLQKSPNDLLAWNHLFTADNVWGAGAFLLIATGLLRAFGGFEKGTGYYVHNHLFLYKMGLVVAILALEVKPMILLVKWRSAFHQKIKFENVSKLSQLQTINDIETIIMIFIPFIASAMARALVY